MSRERRNLREEVCRFTTGEFTMSERTEKRTVRGLRCGERVALSSNPYGTATVQAITGTGVRLVAPYIHVSDFTYGCDGTGEQCITYTGISETFIPFSDSRLIDVYVMSQPVNKGYSKEHAERIKADIESKTGRPQRIDEGLSFYVVEKR
jgi:hypothetical protein